MNAPHKPRGAFITMEGGEGGGKSTQVRALVRRLAEAGIDAIATREPGGSAAAEQIRAALLDGMFETLGPKVEALLFAAARIDHLDVKIKPALAAGAWVVSDRFHDSTRAYQGAFGGLEPRFLDALDRVVLDGLRPDLTLILDLPAHIGLARAAARRQSNAVPDRFEKQSLEFHESLRQTFLTIAAEEPDRCVIVDATQSPEDVEQAIWDAITHRLDLPSVASRA
jgi:dTMP kinase